jgi:hypothetical protein
MTLAWSQLSYRQTEVYSFATETAVAFITAKMVALAKTVILSPLRLRDCDFSTNPSTTGCSALRIVQQNYLQTRQTYTYLPSLLQWRFHTKNCSTFENPCVKIYGFDYIWLLEHI